MNYDVKCVSLTTLVHQSGPPTDPEEDERLRSLLPGSTSDDPALSVFRNLFTERIELKFTAEA